MRQCCYCSVSANFVFLVRWFRVAPFPMGRLVLRSKNSSLGISWPQKIKKKKEKKKGWRTNAPNRTPAEKRNHRWAPGPTLNRETTATTNQGRRQTATPQPQANRTPANPAGASFLPNRFSSSPPGLSHPCHTGLGISNLIFRQGRLMGKAYCPYCSSTTSDTIPATGVLADGGRTAPLPNVPDRPSNPSFSVSVGLLARLRRVGFSPP